MVSQGAYEFYLTNDQVFYGPRSLVFLEADNRKWTTMSAFEWVFPEPVLASAHPFPSPYSLLFGKWDITGEKSAKKKRDM